jgi:beta-galactosidase
MTDTIMRDRNHPSLVLYSIGNEIRDTPLANFMATATGLVATCHTVDPTRPVTQALFQPSLRGYYPGATGAPTSGPTMVDILDVFGANYRIAEVITAIAFTPHHAGVVTEDGSTTTSNWGNATAAGTVLGTPALTGDFIWTAFDYLGEAIGTGVVYPVVGASTGIMDRLGTMKPIAYSWQNIWGTATTAPAAGTAATKIVLTADHPTIVTDLNDVSYIKAAITDATNRVVTTAANPVTFAVTGPGTIIAVDSGSLNAETFRGTMRMAYQGLAFAIVQATGPGTITVTATSAGLTTATATVTSTTGAFVPCAGTCN